MFDASGASDLDKVEFSLHKIGDSKEDIQTATKFNTYSKDERWGWFNYSIRDLTPGKYQLKGVADDKDGGKSNTVQGATSAPEPIQAKGLVAQTRSKKS
ncbi:MAG: hypothetical protein U7127_01015 [Phormidium sp.]